TLDGAFDTALPPKTGRQHNLYTSSVNLISAALAVLLTVEAGTDARPVPAPAPAAPAPLAQVLARIDQLHARRDDRAAFTEELTLVQGALARAPKDYGVLWRAAR